MQCVNVGEEMKKLVLMKLFNGIHCVVKQKCFRFLSEFPNIRDLFEIRWKFVIDYCRSKVDIKFSLVMVGIVQVDIVYLASVVRVNIVN